MYVSYMSEAKLLYVQNLFHGHLSKYVAPLGNISTFCCIKSLLWTPATRSEPISGYFYNFRHNFENNLEVVQVRSPPGQYQYLLLYKTFSMDTRNAQ